MVRHWLEEGGTGWLGRAALNGMGALLTAATLVLVTVAVLVMLVEANTAPASASAQPCTSVRSPTTRNIGRSLVVVPVGAVNKLTQEAISAASHGVTRCAPSRSSSPESQRHPPPTRSAKHGTPGNPTCRSPSCTAAPGH